MRVVVVEDHLLYREVLVRLCEECGHSVAAAVGCGTEAVQACVTLRPHLLVLDLRLPGMPGGGVLESLVGLGALPAVLVISACLSEYVVYQLERLPMVTAFIGKEDAVPDRIRDVLTAVAAGRRWLYPPYVAMRQRLRCNPTSFDKLLTERQLLFLRYVALDYMDEDIAGSMGVSVRTVEGYRSTTIQKLNLANSLKLAAYARERGFDLFPPRLRPPNKPAPPNTIETVARMVAS